MTVLAGGCLCGAVRYATAGPVSNETLCHCTACRRASGAPAVAWFSVPLASVNVTGELASFHSSDVGTRRFCPRCGTPVSFHDARVPDLLDLATATLDDPALAPPKDQTWTGSAIAWTHAMLATPGHAQARRPG